MVQGRKRAAASASPHRKAAVRAFAALKARKRRFSGMERSDFYFTAHDIGPPKQALPIPTQLLGTSGIHSVSRADYDKF
jgi:hypothetical protein